jgi:hypothetical protein
MQVRVNAVTSGQTRLVNSGITSVETVETTLVSTYEDTVRVTGRVKVEL